MLFVFRLAKDLGMSVERVLNDISVLEIRAWAEYFTYVHDMEKEAANKAKSRR